MIPVKWVFSKTDLLDADERCKCCAATYTPVIPIAALTKVVEGLREIDSHCDRIAVLSKCSGSVAEARTALEVINRLLAQLEEGMK